MKEISDLMEILIEPLLPIIGVLVGVYAGAKTNKKNQFFTRKVDSEEFTRKFSTDFIPEFNSLLAWLRGMNSSEFANKNNDIIENKFMKIIKLLEELKQCYPIEITTEFVRLNERIPNLSLHFEYMKNPTEKAFYKNGLLKNTLKKDMRIANRDFNKLKNKIMKNFT